MNWMLKSVFLFLLPLRVLAGEPAAPALPPPDPGATLDKLTASVERLVGLLEREVTFRAEDREARRIEIAVSIMRQGHSEPRNQDPRLNQRRSAVGHTDRHSHQCRDDHSQSQTGASCGVTAQGGADQNVQAPARSRGEGEQKTHEVELAESLHHRDHAGWREQGPDGGEPAPRGPRNSMVTAIPSGIRASAR